MLEYRANKLSSTLSQEITTLLEENIKEAIDLDQAITSQNIELWKEGNLVNAKHRITVDQYVKLCLATRYKETFDNSPERIDQLIFSKRFEAYAALYPEKTALIYNNEKLSYREVNERANQIAYFLQDKKIGEGDIVATFLPREPEWIISILAIWKTGAAFTAIDPVITGTSPNAIEDYFDKFKQTIDDAKPAFIITNSDHQYLLPKFSASDNTSPTLLCLDSLENELLLQPTEDINVAIEPDQLAYIIYTSGSSGKPKGVEIEHRGLMPCLEAHRECVDLTQDSIMAQYALCDFDAWIAEMLILGLGGTLAIVPSEIRLDPKALKNYYNQHEISVVIFTPELLKKLGGPVDFKHWRALFIVGEPFGWDFVKQWKTDVLQVINGYGLTETTICATLENLDPHLSSNSDSLSIGQAIVGTNIILRTPTNLDVMDYGQETLYEEKETPVGKEGEIWVSGVSLTTGYRSEAQHKNKWRFVDIDDKTYYKTGDKGLKTEDGHIFHKGRYSRMVKISGKRLEPPSIEINLTEHDGIEAHGAAVVPVGDKTDDKTYTKLVYFLISKTKENATDADIFDYIHKKEPRTAGIASIIIWKKEFPTTKNEKIDYIALKEEYYSQSKKKISKLTLSENTKYTLESESEQISEHEKILKSVRKRWRKIIGENDFSGSDDFFLKGGSSIDVSYLVRELQLEFNDIQTYLNGAFIYECTTLGAQVNWIYNLRHAIAPEFLSSKLNKDAPYLIFCLPSISGNPNDDYTQLASKFDERFQIYGLPARGLTDPSRMPTSIYSMATDYALSIMKWCRDHHQDKPIFMLGWSSGGTQAIETVKVLKKNGFSAFAHVCDTIAPYSFHHLTHEKHIEELLKLGSKLSIEKYDPAMLKSNLSGSGIRQNRIKMLFDKLLESEVRENIVNLIKTAKIIRLAENNYIIRGGIPKFYLYRAGEKLLDNILATDNTLNWPKKYIANPDEQVISGDHFEVIKCTALAEQLKTGIISDYNTDFRMLFAVEGCRPYFKVKEILKDHYSAMFKGNSILQQALEYYVPLDGSLDHLAGTEENQEDMRKPLHEQRLLPFLTDKTQKQPLMLLLGESGSGKSTYAHQLNNFCWVDLASNKPKINRIPILVECKSIKADHIKGDFLSYMFENDYGLSKPEIQALKKHPVLIIFDGYDEKNIADFNMYNAFSLVQWNAKILITCRTLYVKELANYKTYFSAKDSFQCTEIYMCPFSKNQINTYITAYCKNNNSKFDIQKGLKENPELMELIENPLLLKMVVVVMPKLIELENSGELYANKHPSVIHIPKFTRADIYKAFIGAWFERESQRLVEKTSNASIKLWKFGSTESQVAFNRFCQHLAEKMFLAGQLEVYYDKNDSSGEWFDEEDSDEDDEWRKFFTVDDASLNDVRSGCPLRYVNKIYSFYHKSFLGYFYASRIYTELFSVKAMQVSDEKLLKHINKLTINKIRIVNDRPALEFLSQSLQGDEKRINRLLTIINASKDDQYGDVMIAASNAITVLNTGYFNFSGQDFSGVKIVGADLRGAYCDQTNFESADLSNVQLAQGWLRKANLKSCNLIDTNFGLYPYLELPGQIFCTQSYPDGALLAVSADNKVFLLDTSTRIISNALVRHDSRVNIICFNCSGELIATGSPTNLIVTDLTKKINYTIPGHDGQIQALSFSFANNLLATSDMSKVIHIWDIDNKRPIGRIKKHTSYVTILRYLCNGKFLLSISHNERFIWNIKEQKLACTLDSSIYDFLNKKDGSSTLAYAKKDNSICLWEVASIEPKLSLRGHGKAITAIKFSPDGDILASGSDDATVRLWNLNDRTLIHTFTKHCNPIQFLMFSPDSRYILSKSSDHSSTSSSMFSNKKVSVTVLLLNIKDKKLSHEFTESTRPTSSNIKFCHDNKLLAYESHNRAIYVLNVSNSSLIHCFQGHSGPISTITFAATNETLISTSWDKSIRFWKINNTNQRHHRESTRHKSRVSSVQFSPDGKTVASAGFDQSLCLWSAQSGIEVQKFKGHTNAIHCVVFSPDNAFLLSAGSDNTIRVWDIKEKALVHTFDGHAGSVRSLQFEPTEGKIFVSCSWDKTIRLWNFRDKIDVHTFEVGSEVTCAQFSPNGKMLAAGSVDKIIRIWSVKTHELKHTLLGHETQVSTLIFSPDSNLLLSIADTESIISWDYKENAQNFTIPLQLGKPSIYTRSYELPLFKLTSIAFMLNAPDENTLIIGSSNKTIHLWDIHKKEFTAKIHCPISMTSGDLFHDKNESMPRLMLIVGDDLGNISCYNYDPSNQNSPFTLQWTHASLLFCLGAQIDKVKVSSKDNFRLMKQLGAIDESTNNSVEQFGFFSSKSPNKVVEDSLNSSARRHESLTTLSDTSLENPSSLNKK